MKIRTLRRHLATDGKIYAPGDEYEDNETNAKQRVESGLVEEVKAKKASENKKASKPDNKAD